jgi:hypothetical protein
MRALTRRLQRLEAAATRLDPSKRRQQFEEFRRTAEEYIRAVRQYLGEPPESEIAIACRNDGKMMPLINQVVAYRKEPLHETHHEDRAFGTIGRHW